MPEPISVLIVDDQQLQRDGFRMLLESQADIAVIGDVADGAHALSLLRRVRADVVLMDIRMPRVNGIVAAERIRADEHVLALGAAPRIILVTALELASYTAEAERVGAHALMYKDAPPEELLDAIRTAAASDGAQ
jgi:DNA-binding NarL/FixJ family response regulator